MHRLPSHSAELPDFGALPGVFIGTLARVAYLPDPEHFKLFAAALLLN